MILPSLANKGPIIVARDLCREFIRFGHFCTVFYFDDIIEIDFPCKSVRISFWNKFNFGDFDIVHSHMYRPDAYIFLHKPLFTSKTKFVSTIHQHISFKAQAAHSNYNSLKFWFGLKSWLFFLKRMDANVVLSDYYKKFYEKEVHLKRVYVILNGRYIDKNVEIEEVDVEMITRFRLNKKVIGAIAYITRRKGYDQLISGLSCLPEYCLILIGKGEKNVMDELMQQAIDLKVQDRCLFIDQKIDAYRYLKVFDIFAMCSRSEGFPLSLIESAAFGCPTICSDIPIFRSIVTQNEVAFFYLDNIDSLVQAVLELDTKPDVYSKNINSYYEKYLTAEIMAQNYIDLYSKL